MADYQALLNALIGPPQSTYSHQNALSGETKSLVPTLQERMKKIVEPAEDWEGVDAAVMANQDRDSLYDWYKPINSFFMGAGTGLPLLAPLTHTFPSSSKGADPGKIYARNGIAHARVDFPKSYYAGLAAGVAPTLLYPPLGLPWAAYNVAADPGVQRTVRDYFRWGKRE